MFKRFLSFSNRQIQLSSLCTFTSQVPAFRLFNTSTHNMSDLAVELTAPNGRKYSQPTGLFINNEWVKAKSGEKITSINPTQVTCSPNLLQGS
ncbi:MAG: hypothetical protein LQ347_000748 [Umbilicaria vellea]|nr:MAG: hypothetical protein LQ347_000748 [Umbilicaria vellea]